MNFTRLKSKIEISLLAALVFIFSLLYSVAASAQNNASAFITAKRYNLNGQVTGIIRSTAGGATPIHLATRNTYNSKGQLESVEVGYLTSWASDAIDPVNWTDFILEKKIAYTYDNWGRKLTESLQDKWGIAKRLNQYSYDTLKRLDCVAVRMNVSTFGVLASNACQPAAAGSHGSDRIKKYTYDSRDRIEFIEKAFNTSLSQYYTRYTYNNYWERASVKDANGNQTEYRYDGFGRLKRTVYPSKTSVGFLNESDYSEIFYDRNNNVKTNRKRNGSTITFTYDNNDRVIIKDLANNAYSPDTYYDYDLRGLMLYARFGSSATGNSISNVYDGFGNMTDTIKTWNGTSFVLGFGYDKNSNRTRITNNGIYKYDFDNLNRPMQISSYVSNTSGNYYQPILDMKYNSIGRLESIRRNTSEEKEVFIAGIRTDYFYDTAQRLNNTKFSFPSNSSWDWAYDYGYNPANQITSLTTTASTVGFENKVYVGNENRTGSYTPNGLNQYTSINSAVPTYDSNGNLTSDSGGTYQYDDENRLRSTGGTLPSSTLEYDPLGRLHSVTIAGQQTTYLFDGEVLVRESGVAGGTYLHSGNGDDPLVRVNGSPKHLMTNHQGSVVASIALSGGAMALSNQTYDVYGIPKASNNENIGYTGQLWIKPLGIYHYKARIYLPKLGRFLQVDPVGYNDQMNTYAYVGNDPLNKVDPTGMYGRGTGWEGKDEEWRKFDAAQKRAAKRMDDKAQDMEEKASKLDKKNEDGGDKLRERAAYLREGAKALRSDGSDGFMANALSQADYQASGGTQAGAAFVRKNSSIMNVNLGNSNAWSAGNKMAGWVVGHESLHSAGLNDYIAGQRPNHTTGYKFGTPADKTLFNQMKTQSESHLNPDHIMDEVY